MLPVTKKAHVVDADDLRLHDQEPLSERVSRTRTSLASPSGCPSLLMPARGRLPLLELPDELIVHIALLALTDDVRDALRYSQTCKTFKSLLLRRNDLGPAAWATCSPKCNHPGVDQQWHSAPLSVVLRSQQQPGEDKEGVSYDFVRWVGSLNGLYHPCVCTLRFAQASFNPEASNPATLMHACFESVDTSLQKIVCVDLPPSQSARLPLLAPASCVRICMTRVPCRRAPHID